jgi:AcrR family transcriptional regulator
MDQWPIECNCINLARAMHTVRTERTRNRLIRAAERLFGARGINGVSLREINRLARQRNASALHYHFGSRDGLVRAILRKHLHRLAAEQAESLAAIEEAGQVNDLRSLADVIVRPFAELIIAGSSQRAFVKIYTELVTDPKVPIADLVALSEPVRIRATRLLLEHLPIDAPKEFLVERVFLAIELVMHAVADRARLEDARRPRRTPVPLPLFTSNLADMFTAAVCAPIGARTAELLSEPAVKLPAPARRGRAGTRG